MYTIYFLIHNFRCYRYHAGCVLHNLRHSAPDNHAEPPPLWIYCCSGLLLTLWTVPFRRIEPDLFLQAGKAFGKTGIQTGFGSSGDPWTLHCARIYLLPPAALFTCSCSLWFSRQNPSFSCLMLCSCMVRSGWYLQWHGHDLWGYRFLVDKLMKFI